MADYPKNIKFPANKTKRINISLTDGIKSTDIINHGGFSKCENLSYKKYPVLSSSDIRKSIHSQLSFYNITAPSTEFLNDGGSNMFSFGDYILIIHWGMCGENVSDGYQYIKDGKLVSRDFKKGNHYVICDCIKAVKNTFALVCSCVIYDEDEIRMHYADYEINADPRLYRYTDVLPSDMGDCDTGSVYLYDGKYYYYDGIWIEMRLNKTYYYDNQLFYYDSYLECWLLKKGYSDKKRDAKIFSEWSSDDPSLMFGNYQKYIVIMPDAVMIELDEKGFPKEDKYFDGEWITAGVQRSINTSVYSMKKRSFDAYMTDSDGVTHSFPYPDVSSIMPGATRLFAVGEGRIYATKPNTLNDFSYDSVYSFSPSNAWAAAVANEGVSSSKLCALYDYSGEIIAFSNDTSYKIYGKTNPFRIGTLFNHGTLSQKSVTECDGKLYFADDKGVYCYNGTSVACISDDIKPGIIHDACFTSARGVLYMYLDCDSDKAIYTYDTKYKCFLKMALPYDSYITSEDRVTKEIKDMVTVNDNVYVMTYASYDTRPGGLETVNYDTSKIQIYCITSGSSKYLGYKEKWFLETNPFNTYIPDRQRVTEMEILLKGDGESSIRVYLLSEDQTPDNENMITEYVPGRELSVMRYSIRKSESLYHRLYIEGEGDADIHSIELMTYSYNIFC